LEGERVTDWKILLLVGASIASLGYCFWKTHADWRQKGFGPAVIWGIVACLGAFFFVALLFARSMLAHL
jgi:hypothetical protein